MFKCIYEYVYIYTRLHIFIYICTHLFIYNSIIPQIICIFQCHRSQHISSSSSGPGCGSGGFKRGQAPNTRRKNKLDSKYVRGTTPEPTPAGNTAKKTKNKLNSFTHVPESPDTDNPDRLLDIENPSDFMLALKEASFDLRTERWSTPDPLTRDRFMKLNDNSKPDDDQLHGSPWFQRYEDTCMEYRKICIYLYT
jgi:hypothetical protein